MLTAIIMVIQLAVSVLVGLYFYRQLKSGETRETGRTASSRDNERLMAMRRISLTVPLSEKVRPRRFEDLIGQEDGVRALRAILCGENPQHVLLYGPPGVGKTCAARLVLEDAKKSAGTPFRPDAPFIEMDATCVRFDERAIADPLIGSVHDPIYQGAGSLGVNGIPQPKEGAVTKAHGGVLFLDEIGELHPIQLNKLLKVLEDRKVRLESAYYNPDDPKIPRHIRDIFENGLPADFRLVAATTRPPEELPPALRSRCMEVYFRALDEPELAQIAQGAAARAEFALDAELADKIGRFAHSGRDAIQMVQMAAGLAKNDGRRTILLADIEWVIECGHYSPRPNPGARREPMPGRVLALAVHGAHEGALLDLEASVLLGDGRVTVTGVVEEEELTNGGSRLRRTSTALAAAKNVLTVLRSMGEPLDEYDLHINFPGGAPVDGPSAGVAMAVAVYSALHQLPVRADLALTGEVSVQGRVLPVGGVTAKLGAAIKGGLTCALIPEENDQVRYRSYPIEVRPIRTVEEALLLAVGKAPGYVAQHAPAAPLAAEGV